MRYDQFRYYRVYKRGDNYYSSRIEIVDVSNEANPKVDENYIKNLQYDFVIVEKNYSYTNKKRYYADYEIFQNGERKDIVMNGWTFPSQVGNARYAWDYGFVHNYKCISPSGNTVSFHEIGLYYNTDRMPVEYIFRLYDYISRFNEDEARLVAKEHLKNYRDYQTRYYGTVSDNIEECDTLKQMINDHKDDQDKFVLSELKKAYNQRCSFLKHTIEEEYPKFEIE